MRHLLCVAFLASALTVGAQQPFTIAEGLYDASDSLTLGLSQADGTHTVMVFRPTATDDHYANGVALAAFKNTIYCMWQSSPTDEDSDDTHVMYSHSDDGGLSWSLPDTLQAALPHAYCTSGGFIATADEMVAFINIWPDSISPKGGFTYCRSSRDGKTWSALQPVMMADGMPMPAVIEQDFREVDGGIVSAAHFQPGLVVCPIYTDDMSGRAGWRRADYPVETYKEQSRGIEPSFFFAKGDEGQQDSTIVMILRDQRSSYHKMAASSSDVGRTWSQAVVTDMPDARTKQCAGNLPGGTAFMVGCPVTNKKRYPLVVTLSDDGRHFDRAFLLRSGAARQTDGDGLLQPRRYAGKAKSLGYSYPKALVYGDYLFVGYATNKEDVEITRIPLAALVK